jgi:long-chain acyl-CoA synthetase
VRIVDPGTGIDVDFGAEGELIVRGPNLMLGYYNQPEATASAVRKGWYHTGDLARSDKHGFLTITGRLKELIIRGGQNIAPAEVEVAVSAHDGVLDCAVIGAPHDMLGEVPVVFVVPRPGATVEVNALLAHCRSQLSAYKVPAAVYFTDSIPRTGSGKTMRYKLREELVAGRASAAAS